MKVLSIIQRGSRKDFTDVYFILQKIEIGPEDLVTLFQQKYGAYNELILYKALGHNTALRPGGHHRLTSNGSRHSRCPSLLTHPLWLFYSAFRARSLGVEEMLPCPKLPLISPRFSSLTAPRCWSSIRGAGRRPSGRLEGRS